ncbi:MAG: prepilin peptidase [Pirellulales bacterium]
MNNSWMLMAGVGLYALAAAWTDLRSHRIPNALTVPAALAALAYHSLAPQGLGFLMSLAGLGVGLALLFVPAALGGSGMGDVKLLAALGAWLGPKLVLVAFVLSAVSAAFLAAAVLTYFACSQGVSKTQAKFLHAGQPVRKPGQRGPARVVPFAVPVALSTWLVLGWLVVRAGI